MPVFDQRRFAMQDLHLQLIHREERSATVLGYEADTPSLLLPESSVLDILSLMEAATVAANEAVANPKLAPLLELIHVLQSLLVDYQCESLGWKAQHATTAEVRAVYAELHEQLLALRRLEERRRAKAQGG
jgi:hypothetical protein